MAKKNLIVYDDEKNNTDRYIDTLTKIKLVNDSYDIFPYYNTDFSSVYETLKKRRMESRKKPGKKEWDEMDIDDAAIVIIDYDLVKANLDIPDNGEDLIYTLRLFSTCECIVLLNRFGHNTFDLNLIGHVDSYADINIGMEDLKNEGLWNGISKGYKPWYWPSLISFQKNYSKRFSDVLKNFRTPIKEFFNLGDSFFYSLPQSSLQYLGMDRKNIEKITFEEFFNNSDLILKTKDNGCGFSTNMKARIIASRLTKWFEKTVIPGQDILIDCPHLVSRFPSLVKDNKIKTWNDTAIIDNIAALPINKKIIEKYRFKQDYWLSRPCWFWDALSEYNKISEVAKPWEKKETGWVFAEDRSSFYSINECREFVSAVDSPFRKRYVKPFKEVEYRPKTRLYPDE